MDAPLGDADRSLAQHLKARRKQLRRGQAEAARRADVGRMAWFEWEAGRRHPRDYNYDGIDQAMEWEPGGVEAILAGDEPTPLPEPTRPRDPRKDPEYLKWRAGYKALIAKGYSREEAIALLDEDGSEGGQEVDTSSA